MTRRVQFEYSVIIEADEYDDIQHQHLSEELEAYFNTYDNNITRIYFALSGGSIPSNFSIARTYACSLHIIDT